MSVYSTLVGILNAKLFEFGEEVGVVIIKYIKDYNIAFIVVALVISVIMTLDRTSFFQVVDLLFEELKSSFLNDNFHKIKTLVSYLSP